VKHGRELLSRPKSTKDCSAKRRRRRRGRRRRKRRRRRRLKYMVMSPAQNAGQTHSSKLTKESFENVANFKYSISERH
jgi:hypothetical protein